MERELAPELRQLLGNNQQVLRLMESIPEEVHMELWRDNVLCSEEVRPGAAGSVPT
jgi:hypothetical protein